MVIFMSELSSLLQNKTQTWVRKKVCENKDFCYVVMRSEDIKIVEFTKYNKYDKVIIIFMQIFNV